VRVALRSAARHESGSVRIVTSGTELAGVREGVSLYRFRAAARIRSALSGMFSLTHIKTSCGAGTRRSRISVPTSE
jgi:hypothetical protein